MLPLLAAVIVGSSLVACHKKSPEKVVAKPMVKRSPEEIKRGADAARQSVEGLKAPMSDLTARFLALHKQYDPLPPALPGFFETRQKFYAAAEGLGMMTAKVPWFSGRIDEAVKAQDGAELDQISKEIAHTYDEIKVVDRVSMELLHEILPFTKKAVDAQADGKNKCE
jgi:hypothetical protein